MKLLILRLLKSIINWLMSKDIKEESNEAKVVTQVEKDQQASNVGNSTFANELRNSNDF